MALARAVAGNPQILLADEPTGNLDQTTGAQIISLMFALRERNGATLMLITHPHSVGTLLLKPFAAHICTAVMMTNTTSIILNSIRYNDQKRGGTITLSVRLVARDARRRRVRCSCAYSGNCTCSSIAYF